MYLLKKIRNYFIPHIDNAYRPGTLGRASLIFFLICTLGVEGLLVGDLAAHYSDLHNEKIASVIQMLPVVKTPLQTANEVLGGMALLLTLFVCLAFFIHIDIQAKDLLLGGVTVVLVALVCIVANTHLLHLVEFGGIGILTQ